MNIVQKIKISNFFETLFFNLKRCLAESIACLQDVKAIFQEKIMWVASLTRVYNVIDGIYEIQRKDPAEERPM